MSAMKRAIRDVYGETLAQLGKENPDIVALDADVGSSSKSIVFGKAFPERYFNVGVAEANMVAMAAGLATAGKIPFANTFAAFMVLRAADPVRSLIAYTGLNVKLAGTYAGLSDSYDGASHHAIADMAFMRAMTSATGSFSASSISRYSTSAETPTPRAEAKLSFMCGLKPSE